jgi:hypothetical protein
MMIKILLTAPLENADALKALGRQRARTIAQDSLGCIEGWNVWGWGSIPYISLQMNKEAMRKPQKPQRTSASHRA